MARLSHVIVPDIGGATGVEVIEIAVTPGEFVAAEDTLFTVESDKATMDIPSPLSGKLVELKISIGDKVDEGSLVAIVEESSEENSEQPALSEPELMTSPEPVQSQGACETDPAEAASATDVVTNDVVTNDVVANKVEVFVPDIGGAAGVEVIEISVAPGDHILEDTSLITVESDKASMEIPSPFAGTLRELKVALGDKLDEGSLIAVIEREGPEQISDDQAVADCGKAAQTETA